MNKIAFAEVFLNSLDLEDEELDLREQLNILFNYTVPEEGMADTVAGEIIRASMFILYRWYNDGDKIDNEILTSSYNYLNIVSEYFHTDYDSDISSVFEDMIADKDYYDDYIEDFCYSVLSLLKDNINLFELINRIDSRNFKIEEFNGFYSI